MLNKMKSVFDGKKKLAFGLASLALVLSATVVLGKTNTLLGRVDFATTDSECVVDALDADLDSWGPTTAGGNYGGNQPGSCVVWESGENETPEAIITFPKVEGSVRTVSFDHLDGIADDSFIVSVLHPRGEWIEIGSYADVDPANDPETWHNAEFELIDSRGHGFSLGGGKNITVKFEAIGKQWSSRDHWGQLAIDYVEFWGNGK